MYQRAFTASETFPTVPTGHYELSPSRERYYDIQTKILAENNVVMDKDKICKAISQIKLEDEAYHEHNIEILTNKDDDYSSPWKGDAVVLNAVTNSTDSGEITFKIPATESDLDKNPAARKEPIKDTPILKAPITGYHLGKRLRQSESGPTDMNPVVNPVVTELDFIGQGGPRAIIGEPIPRASLKEGKI